MGLADTSESLQRALLPVATLRLVAHAPQHGYALIAALRAAGFTKAQGGTLYPLLRAMEEDGLVASRWEVPATGPARKVFEATSRGLARSAADEDTIEESLRTVRRLGAPGGSTT
ncbi:PadR family transcriptional regulator [Actinotalea ferrariae CF5-4]|uniref:PadR family transcriptional regulator n=1 Tax=Actinotalea ferrariae CF5-4 TaxID=948458 RepID=A0A021VXB4_9CELL|nr:PadR family transcriptional regulator [Actinotalea ferrariae]EYR63722.1 PadR family transcriptional regulator [Actinotalea ferrariae CF5-4]